MRSILRLDRIARVVRLLEAGRARHADGDVHEIALSGAPHAHALGLQHAVGFVHGVHDLLAQPARRHVQQRVRGRRLPSREPIQMITPGHAQRGDRVQLRQPRHAEVLAQPWRR